MSYNSKSNMYLHKTFQYNVKYYRKKNKKILLSIESGWLLLIQIYFKLKRDQFKKISCPI